MKGKITGAAIVLLIAAAAVVAPRVQAQKRHQNAVIDLWAAGKTAFGVYVPSEGQPMPGDPAPPPAAGGRGRGEAAAGAAAQAGRGQQAGAAGGRGGGGQRGQGGQGGQAGQAQPRPVPRYTRAIGETLASNPLYDFVFLNLEGSFSLDAVKAIAEGLRGPAAVSRKTLIVRIPTIEDAGEELTRYRVKASFDAGADAVTIPGIVGLDQAKQAIGMFAAASSDIWTPDNPNGEKLGMLMIEDPLTLTLAREIAELKGYSMLACGVGSMGGAFRSGGVVAGLVSLGLLESGVPATLGELATAKVLAETRRTKLANMITVDIRADQSSPASIQRRVKDGFQALLFSGPGSDEAIKTGRALAGR